MRVISGRGSRCVQPARLTQRRHQHRLRCSASSAAGAPSGDDPYKVLGLPQNADSGKVEQKYKMLKSQAERDGNKELAKQIEAAHSTIFMSSLSSRLAGSGPKDKKIRYADRQAVTPWMPRVALASPQLIKITIAAQLATFVWQCFITMRMSPQSVPIVGAVLTIYKIYQLHPTWSPDQQKKIEGNMRNIVRGLIIATMATFAGILVFWTGPSWLSQQVLGYLPAVQADHTSLWTVGGMCICNALATIFLQ